MTYSQRDFAHDYREALNDRRQVFVLGDTICAFIAGAAFATFVIFGLLALTA